MTRGVPRDEICDNGGRIVEEEKNREDGGAGNALSSTKVGLELDYDAMWPRNTGQNTRWRLGRPIAEMARDGRGPVGRALQLRHLSEAEDIVQIVG